MSIPMSSQQNEATGTPKTLEERLAPWLDHAEYLIAYTIAIFAWTAGWVNLIAYQSETNQVVFGQYSVPYFAIIVVYSLGFVFWFWLFSSLRALEGARHVIAFFQRMPLLFLLVWVWTGVFIWLATGNPRFAQFLVQFQVLQGAYLVLVLLFSVLVLFAKPLPDAPSQTWRKGVLAGVGLVLGAELLLQGLAVAGQLPTQNLTGITVPYGRVYQADEGTGSGLTNQFGWYYPDFQLLDGSRRILLNGDTFVEALQVPKSAHLGMQLQAKLNEVGATSTEVMAQGLMGYGSTQFLNPLMAQYLWEPLEPNESIVFFHIANDFQVVYGDEPGKLPRVMINDEGAPEIVEADHDTWHTLAHIIIKGHERPNFWRTIGSNLLLINMFGGEAAADYFDIAHPDIPLNIEQATEDQPFGPAGFMFEVPLNEQGEQSVAIARAQLQAYIDHMRDLNVSVRLVTIPYYPAYFYDDADADGWTPVMNGYDLFQPERELQSIVADYDIPFLAMGAYMQTQGLAPSDIQALYFREGTGHLTEDGHALFADAVYDCFYAPDDARLRADAGCLVGEEN